MFKQCYPVRKGGKRKSLPGSIRPALSEQLADRLAPVWQEIEKPVGGIGVGRIERDAEMERVLSMPNWKGVKLEHARHYLWLTHHDEVLREMTTFLGTSS